MTSCVINAVEERSIATCDIVGVYLHADMVARNKMVDILVAVNVEKYARFMHTAAKGEYMLYLLLQKVIHGCLKSDRLFNEHLKKILRRMDFILNPYDDCVANKNIKGTQCTISWHVNDPKVSHKEERVLNR